jgi:hypothetical protein
VHHDLRLARLRALAFGEVVPRYDQGATGRKLRTPQGWHALVADALVAGARNQELGFIDM